MSKRSPKTLELWLVHWVDIEGEAGWGEGAKELPVVTQVGFLHSRPNKKQKVPFWKFKTAQVEEEPGGMVSIPDACIIHKEKIGKFDVVWRE